VSEPGGKALRAAFVVGLAVTVGLLIWALPGHRGWFDLRVYYEAVAHWIDGGRLYDYRVAGTPYGFTYPPFAALALAPLTLLGWHAAVAMSVLLSTIVTGLLLLRLAGPIAGTLRERHGQPRWLVLAIGACLVAFVQPVRETVGFGQVNLILLGLVWLDLLLLRSGPARSRWAGIGIGLAAAIKLTPAIFIGYLLITRRWRAAALATGAAAAATALAWAVLPDDSLFFWTEAVGDTDRVGALSYVSNQSLQGMLARLDTAGLDPAAIAAGADTPHSRPAWLLLAGAVAAVWAVRARRAAAGRDEVAGFALTGLAACLISPVSWVHHLVWALPALFVLADAGLRAGGRRRRALLAWAAGCYLTLCSSVVWLWKPAFDGAGPLARPHDGPEAFVGANAYLWVMLALLLWLPVRSRPASEQTDAEQQGAQGDARAADRDEPDQLVGLGVGRLDDGQEEAERHQDRRGHHQGPDQALESVGVVGLVDVGQRDQGEDDQDAGVRVPGRPQ
jgi:alpha-1,2-mannosyltransferase